MLGHFDKNSSGHLDMCRPRVGVSIKVSPLPLPSLKPPYDPFMTPPTYTYLNLNPLPSLSYPHDFSSTVSITVSLPLNLPI